MRHNDLTLNESLPLPWDLPTYCGMHVPSYKTHLTNLYSIYITKEKQINEKQNTSRRIGG